MYNTCDTDLKLSENNNLTLYTVLPLKCSLVPRPHPLLTRKMGLVKIEHFPWYSGNDVTHEYACVLLAIHAIRIKDLWFDVW